jgi:hypothetical protein
MHKKSQAHTDECKSRLHRDRDDASFNGERLVTNLRYLRVTKSNIRPYQRLHLVFKDAKNQEVKAGQSRWRYGREKWRRC